ncbi:hypothetical protein [Arthrobacter woluwensis]
MTSFFSIWAWIASILGSAVVIWLVLQITDNGRTNELLKLPGTS